VVEEVRGEEMERMECRSVGGWVGEEGCTLYSVQHVV
jgi:hypothetical protein